MADTHKAAFAGLELNRKEIYKRILPVFQKYKIWFTHSVRGLLWDNEYKEFVPNLEQELEDINKFQDAFLETYSWTCACFDLRFFQWSFELYLYNKCGSELARFEHILLSFPHSLYKMALEDVDITEQWLLLLKDIGIAIGNLTMICGPNVPIDCFTESSLLARFERYVKRPELLINQIHTAFLPISVLNESIISKLQIE
jgi:hypothetical protein